MHAYICSPSEAEPLLGPHARRTRLASQDLEAIAAHACKDDHLFRAKRLDRTLSYVHPSIRPSLRFVACLPSQPVTTSPCRPNTKQKCTND